MKKFVQVFGKIFFLNTWTNFFTLGQFFLTLSNFSEFFLVFSWKNTLFLKTRKKCEKALSFTHCSFSVFKKLSSYNLLFFSGFSIRKMAASDHSEVSAYSLDLKKNLGSHFRNLKTLEKSKIILGQFFFTPREDNAWRKVPFFLSKISAVFRGIWDQWNWSFFCQNFLLYTEASEIDEIGLCWILLRIEL